MAARKPIVLYTKEEVKALTDWLVVHKDEMPDSLELDQATTIPDVKKTCHLMSEMALESYERPGLKGHIEILFRIQKKLQDLGIG
jgi:hypothetical protein